MIFGGGGQRSDEHPFHWIIGRVKNLGIGFLQLWQKPRSFKAVKGSGTVPQWGLGEKPLVRGSEGLNLHPKAEANHLLLGN